MSPGTMIKEQFIGNIVPARILDRRGTRSRTAPEEARRIAANIPKLLRKTGQSGTRIAVPAFSLLADWRNGCLDAGPLKPPSPKAGATQGGDSTPEPIFLLRPHVVA
jgi:hypothetical protein